jgi:hypothetical protein
MNEAKESVVVLVDSTGVPITEESSGQFAIVRVKTAAEAMEIIGLISQSADRVVTGVVVTDESLAATFRNAGIENVWPVHMVEAGEGDDPANIIATNQGSIRRALDEASFVI